VELSLSLMGIQMLELIHPLHNATKGTIPALLEDLLIMEYVWFLLFPFSNKICVLFHPND